MLHLLTVKYTTEAYLLISAKDSGMVFGTRLEESVAFAMSPANYVLSKMLGAT